MSLEMTDACREYILSHADDIDDCIDDFDELAEDLKHIRQQEDIDDWFGDLRDGCGLLFKL
jgi:hypothetical protein